jgi:hypothetical protein
MWTRCTEKGSGGRHRFLRKVLGGGQGALTRCQEAGTVCWESVGRWIRCTEKVSGSRYRLLGKCRKVDILDKVHYEGVRRQTPFVGKMLGGGQGALRRCQETDTVCWESAGSWTRCTEKVSGGRYRLLGKCWELDKVY